MSTTLIFLLGFCLRLFASQTASAEHLFTKQMPSREFFNPAKRSITASTVIEKMGVKFAVGTLGSLMLERLLNIDGGDNPECAISIYNDQVSTRLVNPRVFIKHGGNSLPPALVIKNNSTETTTFDAIFKPLISDTSGILSYELNDTAVRLFIYWKVGFRGTNRFMVQLLDKYDDSLAGLTAMYKQMDTSPEMIKTKGAMQHYVFDTTAKPLGPLKLVLYIRAEMNMLPEAQLSIRISDSNPAQAFKRDLGATAILSLSAVTVSIVFKKIQSYIPTDQSCTILIENVSKNTKLVEPVWYITAGQVVNLIPWEIENGEIGEASISIPFGGPGKLVKTFSHTIFFVCYQIDKTGLAVVVATWFPLKLQMQSNRYSIFLMHFTNYATPVTTQASTVITALGDTLLNFYDKPAEFEQKLASLKGIDPFLVANLPQNRFPMVAAGPYQTYHEWNFPHVKVKDQIFGSGVKSIKVVAGMGNGYKSGLYLKVDVEKGSPAPGFPLNNPQVYKETPTQLLVEQQLDVDYAKKDQVI